MSISDQRLLRLGLRHDLTTFIHRSFQTISPAQVYHHNWHIEAIAWHLEQCARGKTKRLLITLPPRQLKSICASVAFPAWVLGRNPSARIVCASYSSDLASKHAGDCRAVMESAWYKAAFPATRLGRAKNTELNFITTQQGYRYSTSVGGTLTGRGGNIIIVDDPIKPEDAMSKTRRSAANEWFDRTLYSRLDDKREDVIIVIMQRLHVEDLVGHVLEKEPWTHLCLPAIAETEQEITIGDGDAYLRRIGEVLHERREPKSVLDGLKVSLGSFNYSAQYQQCPVPAEGEIVKWAWFRFYEDLPPRTDCDTVVQSWDTASKASELSDYSVCTTWLVGDRDYYLMDVLREKLDYPDLRRRVITHAREYRADSVLIEDKGSGISLIQDLRDGDYPDVEYPIAQRPEADKVTRMHAQSAQIEAGHVLLPRRAVWLDEFRSELLQFPHGRHDDQVDSLSQFLAWNAERHRCRATSVELFL